jgi:hypothetical protein
VTRTTATLANAAGIVGPVVWVAAVIAWGAVVPGYDPVNQVISELAARGSPGEGLAFIPVSISFVPGLLLAVFGAGLLAVPATRVTGALIVLNAALRITTGAFPCDKGCDMSAPSTSQVVHMVSAVVSGFVLPAAAVTLSLSLRRAGRSRRMGAYSLGTAVLAVVCFMLLLTSGQNRHYVGVYQRMALGLSHAWIVTLAVWNWRRG